MRSMRVREFGDASVVRLEEVPLPVPGAGEVLVEVAATSFNPSEIGLRAGLLRGVVGGEPPFGLGWDVSGTVVGVGPDVVGFEPGERVVGRADGGGTASEFVAVAAGELTRAPVSVPLRDAAAIPLAGLTAWQAVVEHARVEAGLRVFVSGAGGGVGMFAVQLARHAGAEVVATASPRSAERVRRYGASRVVDYSSGAVGEWGLEPVDVLLNLVPLPPASSAALAGLVRPGGRVVSVVGPVEAPAGVASTHMVARNDVADLAALVGLVDAGEVAVDVTGTYRLEELAEVHRLAEAGRISGKVLIVP